MPWDTQPSAPDQRADFVESLSSRACSFAAACARSGVSLEAGYEWLRRATAPQPQPLLGRSRGPRACPRRAATDVERLILGAHDECHGGEREIHACLSRPEPALPSARAAHEVPRRHGRVGSPVPPAPPHRSGRSGPDHLWQMDYDWITPRVPIDEPHQRLATTTPRRPGCPMGTRRVIRV